MFTYKLENKSQLDEVLDKILTRFDQLPEGMYSITVSKPTRTSQQNSAMHLFFEIVSRALNEADLSFTGEFFSENFETEWTPELVKESLWRPVQKKITGKYSTTELTTSEVDVITKAMQQALSSRGVIVNFPNIEDKLNNISSYEIV